MSDLIKDHVQLVEKYQAQLKTLNTLTPRTSVWYQQIQALTETGNALLAVTQRIDNNFK